MPLVAGIEDSVRRHQLPSDSVMLIGGYAPGTQGRIAIGFSMDGGESIDLLFETSRLTASIIEQRQKLDAALSSRLLRSS
jgi:hypothetical protein